MRLSRLLPFAFMLLLSACATVRTTPYRERTANAGDALPGLTYRLPMAQFDLTIVRTLAECPGATKDGKATLLKFSTDVTPESRYVPGEGYTLDPHLIGFLKTSSLELQYFPNGTLKSIGMAAEDRSGQVVENVAKIAGAGLMLASGVPPVAVASAAGVVPLTSAQASALKSSLQGKVRIETVGPVQTICTDEAKDALTALATADDQIKKGGDDLAAANAGTTALVEEILLELKDPDKPEVRTERANLLQAQRTANALIEQGKKTKAEALKKLSVTQTLRWPQHFGDTRQPLELPFDTESRTALAKLLTTGSPERTVGATGETQASLESALRALSTPKAGQTFIASLGKDADQLKAFTERLVTATPAAPTATPAKCLGSDIDGCIDHHLKLSLSVTTEWPLAGDCPAPRKVTPSAQKMTPAPQKEPDECVVALNEKGGEQAKDRAGEREPRGAIQHARNAAYDEGIFIREPAEARILVCRTALATNNICPVGTDLAEIKPLNFPQLGQLRFLRFKVPMFQAKDMGVVLTADGRLERYYMKSTKAALEAATASAANAASTVADALEKRETERNSDAEYAQSATGKALAAQIAELENEEKLRKLRKPPTDDPLKPIRDAASENQVYITQLETQLVREQLQLALDADDNIAAQNLLAIIRSK